MITDNRKARHDYFIEETFEAGIMLMGWEVKALRAKKVSLQEAYVIEKDGELFLFGATITPLIQASTHRDTDPTRTRKLLLHRKDIDRMVGLKQRAGYTMIPVDLHFKNGLIKVQVGLAKGKKQHDKREVEKTRDVNREIQRAIHGARD